MEARPEGREASLGAAEARGEVVGLAADQEKGASGGEGWSRAPRMEDGPRRTAAMAVDVLGASLAVRLGGGERKSPLRLVGAAEVGGGGVSS
ncbi:hypothetical protein PR202_gb08204 [Eleusine coracana subsp. coracana]|uniref:Uncharacterized protein n=1 Tax=Eleusine coracana subsp. coracana TaxID=191504 RepID=A0AAV5EEX8_ELECO|nr:hypothetical protein PR202_gb08204 [Eleusine coracana subsp. coracana]